MASCSAFSRLTAGASDYEVIGAAIASGYSVLTENVGGFTRIAGEHSTAGGHHNSRLGDLVRRGSVPWSAVGLSPAAN
jgi:hypothetical protein